MATFVLNQAELQATITKVQRINDRAAKRGFTGRLAVEYTEFKVTTQDDYDLARTEIFFRTTITGEAPKYNGWTFLAVLDWNSADSVIVRSAPGVAAVNRAVLRPNWCDHCKTKRNRTTIYVVQHEGLDQQLQVGSTCLKDFLGHDTNVVFFHEDELTKDLGLGGYGSSAPDTFDTTYVLAVAWALTKLYGWRPASSPDSIKGMVLDVLQPPRSMPWERQAQLYRVRDLAYEAMGAAAGCQAWILSDDFNGASEYVANLKVAAGSEYVGVGTVGLLASAPQAWAKWQSQTLAQQTGTSTSNWIGAVGDKVTFTATIQSIRYIAGDYGTKILYVLRTADGDQVKWFCTGRYDLGDTLGETVTVKATVKEHTEFRGIKETLVIRAKKMENKS